MNRINWIRLILEAICTALLLIVFPFNIERKIKLFLLYFFVQFVIGRFQKTTLLFYDELRLIFIGWFGFLFCAILTVAFRSESAGYEIIMIFIFSLIDLALTIFINREAHLVFRKQVKKPVVILGTGKTARKLHNVTLANRFSTMDVISFVNCNDSDFFENVNQEVVEQQAPVIPFKELDKLLEERDVDTILIAIPEISHQDLSRVTSKLNKKVENIKFLPYTQDQVNYASSVDDFDGILMISTSDGQIGKLGNALKRSIDVVGGVVGVALLIPTSFFVWLYMRKNGDKGPLFFKQERLGRYGKPFTVWKYRTMYKDAEERLEKVLAEDPELAEEYRVTKKMKNDPRITKAGKKLRETSIDELPQLINVLKGDMSLIGPRPYLMREKDEMGDYYYDIIQMAPGMTGMWQTHGRSNVSFESRLELDDFYFRNWTPWLDFTIFAKTLQILISGDKGAA